MSYALAIWYSAGMPATEFVFVVSWSFGNIDVMIIEHSHFNMSTLGMRLCPHSPSELSESSMMVLSSSSGRSSRRGSPKLFALRPVLRHSL